MVFYQDKILVSTHEQAQKFPKRADLAGLTANDFLGLTILYAQQPLVALSLHHPIALDNFAFVPFRPFYINHDQANVYPLNLAYQWLYFARKNQFCGECGVSTLWHPTENAKICRQCTHVFYPKISPVVIVMVRRADKILLARSKQFRTGFFSVLAGFVEVGETLEEAVKREIKEEVNIEVENVQYFGSQSWPFPHALMIGMTAEYAAGEIQVDDIEIEEAHWYDIDALPQLPSPASIAYRLIQHGVSAIRTRTSD